MSPSVELTHDEMHALLTELGARLHAAGVEATLYIVSGAAIAFELDVRRVTADIDAVFHPETTVRAEVAAMANEKGLPQGWLNDNARAFVPGGDDDAVPFTVPGMSVALASPRHLLAMKMAAARPGQDLDDLALLFDTLGLTTPEAAADVRARGLRRGFGRPSRERRARPHRPRGVRSAQAWARAPRTIGATGLSRSQRGRPETTQRAPVSSTAPDLTASSRSISASHIR